MIGQDRLAPVKCVTLYENHHPPPPMENVKKRRTLSVHLGKNREDWDQLCRRNNIGPSQAIAALVERELGNRGENIKAIVPNHLVQEDEPEETIYRKELRFTPSEFFAIESLAEQEGISFQRWIVNLVRAVLTKHPQFGMKETEALWESSYQLRAIGRNLNQIARHLNEGEQRDIGPKYIEKIVSEIKAHTEKVSKLIAANLDRWKFEQID